jgi:rhodanese-related sulfurtransferase
MKKLFLFALLAAAVTVGQQPSFGQAKVKQLHKADVDALLAAPDHMTMVDVRSPGEIAFWGAFPVYINAEVAEGDAKAAGLEKRLAELPKDRDIVTVATTADRATAAATVLASHGFKVAGAVGVQAYAGEGGELVKFKPYTHWSMNGGTPPPGRTATSARDEAKAYKELHRAEVEALMAAPDKVLVLDVRSPGEVAYWGAFPVFLDIQSDEGDAAAGGIQKHMAEIPKDKPILTVSGRANRSGFAAALLEKNGFKVVGAMGAMTFGEEGGKLIKNPPYKEPAPR